MTEFYGLTPADIDQMTFREVEEYIDQLGDLRRRQEAEHGSR